MHLLSSRSLTEGSTLSFPPISPTSPITHHPRFRLALISQEPPESPHPRNLVHTLDRHQAPRRLSLDGLSCPPLPLSSPSPPLSSSTSVKLETSANRKKSDQTERANERASKGLTYTNPYMLLSGRRSIVAYHLRHGLNKGRPIILGSPPFATA